MSALFGVIFHFIGGFASGSFYIPYKKVKGWAWESYWIVGGIFSWLIVPPLAAYLTIPNYTDIISATDGGILWLTYLFGTLWGIGGLTYGLGVRYLGVSLGSSIILGISMVFGSILPSIYFDFFPAEGKDTFTMLISNTWGQMVLLGLLICTAGIVLCGKAGVMKEKEQDQETKNSSSNEFKIGLGLVVSIISGVLSACFNFGLEAGKPMAEQANAIWKAANPGGGEFLFQNNVTYVVVLWGGLTTNFIWCMILNFKNKTFKNYTDSNTPILKNIAFSALAGITWFLQFFFYGMGESRLGNGPSSWILHMAFIILIANVWGIILNEWKGVSRKTYTTIIMGIVTIVVSVLVVGYGNSLK
ncbi:L-rhamnose-H+ transport protein [Arcticibacter pallidicorallinus]|uniref:L-rhamnose-H+ transport protein n=1 Tax=Arcticibacter pallidicorallinus TaxID=1259464 RepID=A0A2T0U925_9SPHI|nr:L-rhamnose/proton symporter RhaT [Arcticibacter pallidicorallinus]PRY54382.1 L-rhamnose-H+ transport protein [Arcticibacter pallidicorallinus]